MNLHCSDYYDTAGVHRQSSDLDTVTILTDISVKRAGDAIIIIIGIFVVFRCDSDADANAAVE